MPFGSLSGGFSIGGAGETSPGFIGGSSGGGFGLVGAPPALWIMVMKRS